MHVVVKPAYGRVCKSEAQVMEQWESGLDFQMLGLRSGYINLEDVQQERGGRLDGVQFRYGQDLEETFAIKV